MAWEIIFSARSRTDLEQIVRYIARDDPAAAERFGLKLIAQAESLADAPEMGRDYHTGQARDSFLSVPTWSFIDWMRDYAPCGFCASGTQRAADGRHADGRAIKVNTPTSFI